MPKPSNVQFYLFLFKGVIKAPNIPYNEIHMKPVLCRGLQKVVLVGVFKQQFLVFKHHNMYFHNIFLTHMNFHNT